MGTRIVECVIFILLGLFPCSGSCATDTKRGIVIGEYRERKQEKKVLSSSNWIKSTTQQHDITTPIPIPTVPISSNPPPPPATTNNPVMTTPTASSSSTSSSGGSSWCVATQSAPQIALQVALDYACGYVGADCSAIQPGGGSCYYPNTLTHHASYAFNTYYHNNPLPTSCNFGGTAIITNTDPSSDTCQYPSTSTSSSVLNTTNSSGSTVFGAGRPSSNPTTSTAQAALPCIPNFFIISTCLMILLYT